MRKGWKMFWIFCGVLVIAGLAFCAAGIGMGADLQMLIHAYDNGYAYTELQEEITEEIEEPETVETEESISGEKAEAYSNVEKLEVSLGKAALVVTVHEGDQVLVDGSQLTGNRELRCSQDGNELEVEVFGESSISDAGVVLISLPENVALKEASFDVGGGSLQIENISADDLEITVGAGEALVEMFQANELDAECGAGHMTMTGDVGRRANVECGLGAVELELTGKKADYNYSLSCGIGVVALDGEEYSGLGSQKIIDNHQSKQIEIECGVGTVTVGFAAEL